MTDEAKPMDAKTSRIPLWFKLLYTAFLAVLTPNYWMNYGPTNFLYFCDVALFFTLGALWLESPLLASMPAIGILIPQAFWCIDYIGQLFGVRILGMTGYMFDAAKPFFTRGLSFFHFWLPFVVAWATWRLGYDRRALRYWTALAWSILSICYFIMPAPPAPTSNPNLPVNINYVFGLDDAKPQEWMHPHLYFAMLMIGMPLVVYLPTHLLLSRACKTPQEIAHESEKQRA
jgi:hypothetical protein